MKRTLALFFAAAAIAVCAGKTYTITLNRPTTAGATVLKAGEHQVRLVDGNAIIIDGEPGTRTPVKVETVNQKFSRTSVSIYDDNGKARIMEVSLGGSNTKLVAAGPGAGSGSGANGVAAASN